MKCENVELREPHSISSFTLDCKNDLRFAIPDRFSMFMYYLKTLPCVEPSFQCCLKSSSQSQKSSVAQFNNSFKCTPGPLSRLTATIKAKLQITSINTLSRQLAIWRPHQTDVVGSCAQTRRQHASATFLAGHGFAAGAPCDVRSNSIPLRATPSHRSKLSALRRVDRGAAWRRLPPDRGLR